MSYRAVTFIAAAALCIACASTQALAFRGAGGFHAGVYHGAYHGGAYHGAYHGGVYHGAYARRGWGAVGVGVGVGLGAAAVGAAVAAPYYYNSVACGYYPYPPCR